MNVLDWDTLDARVDKPSGLVKKRLKNTWYIICQTLDQKIPPRKRYCGCNRQSILVLCGVFLLVLVSLALGLGIGLRKPSGSQNLPLPTNSEINQGDLTYYSPGLGACGKTSTDGDNICAVSHIIFDAVSRGSNPNTNPLCGLKLRATRYDEHFNAQRSLDLTVVDRCMPLIDTFLVKEETEYDILGTGCAPSDLDISPGAFKKLADSASGRVHVSWAWLSPTSSAH